MSASDRRRRREADQRSGAAPRDDRKITGKNVDGGWAARAAKGRDNKAARDDRGYGPADRSVRRADSGPERRGSSERAERQSNSRGSASSGRSDGSGRARSTGGVREGDSREPRSGQRTGRGGDNGGFGRDRDPQGSQGGKRSDRTGDSSRSGSARQGGGKSAGQRSERQRADRPDPSVPSPRKRRGEPVDVAREVALDVLRAVRERDAYANLVLPKLLRERKISGRDAAFATELTYGACRSQGQLDAVIAACAGRPVGEIDGPILDILRLGVYQLLRTRTSAHAAVDTSVDLARAEFGQGRAGFVNAVLRRAGEKTAEQWIAELAPADPVGKLAFEYAHPTWIAQSFADALGAQAGELSDLLAADDERPVVHLVARPGEITSEELALVTGGEEGRWSPYAVYLDGGDPGQLEPVREGIAAVQDEGSQLVALALSRAPLEGPDQGRWLDLCAGPGGKAALLGALAAIDLFTVDAVEPSEHRAELVRKSTRDLPVTVHVKDGRDTGLEPGYDRILVDAPCTGLGALRRRPEARWRRTPADVPELVTLQRELLTAAWDLLRPGGVVVYSTCSPHLSETVAVVADFVRRTGAEQLDTRELLPGVTDLGDGPSAQLWPHRHGTDAMFLSALRKK
ncbi:16S rRNA (cytosine967-C5)-methyltransferase [Nocardia ignorata]|uniref:16S rRNA (Cytosine967-C5)-methyltransferase n=1 Tax=Nocardia ignorata TaxID=145285 RepID=A0A4R6PSW6_NOCIG|nr:16S rRNA (cytosine967-C5)-methyltransferase [Nocardia ignorata]